MSNSATCQIRNDSTEEQQLATWLAGFTLPLKVTLDDREATIQMDGTVYDHERGVKCPSALAYVHHYNADATAEQVMQSLLIGGYETIQFGKSLQEVRTTSDADLEHAGLTLEQKAFRDRVRFLRVPMEFTVQDEEDNKHTVTLRENRLFSAKWDDGLSALEVLRVFQGWKCDLDRAEDALTVLYYTGTDGKEWMRLSDILAVSPFQQKCFPDKPTDDEIEDEIARYIQAIKTHTDQAGAAVIAQDFMNFLHDGCEEFMTWHVAFRLIALDKCDEFIEIYPEYPDLVAACKRLTTLWERFR